MSASLWHGIGVGVPLLGIAGYLFATDTLGAIRRHAADPPQPLDPMVYARLSFCALACFLIVPIAELASAFNLPWYWLSGAALAIGFKAGQLWEMLKRIVHAETARRKEAGR